ncbi:MAG: FtsX-like permease family protein [Methylovirgula sp.]
MPRSKGLPLRLARRDFRGGLSGFWVFLACLAIGLAAITGVGSVSRSLAEGLLQQGRVILGGDISFELVQREASAAELGFLAAHGRLSQIALLRAMAQRDNGQAALVEIKAVDAAYPEQGSVGLLPARSLQDVLAERNGIYGIAADPTFAARLDLHAGDRFRIGRQAFELRAALISEPDKLAGAIGFGPRILMSEAALRATGLLQPGALVKWVYRLSLTRNENVDAIGAAVRAAFPSAGFEVRTWKNISPQFSRDLDRFSQFLTLVGMSSLLIGGVGVANAVAGFVERKRETIAILKALGASGGFAFRVMLAEVLGMAGIAMMAGIAIGVALPFLLAAGFGALIPFPLAPMIFPREIAAGVLYGVLTTLVFSLVPLGRAHDLPVSTLFRDEIAPVQVWPRRRYLVATFAAALGLAFAGVALAADRKLALIYVAAALGGFILLRAAAALIMAAARRFSHPRRVELRLAIGNLYRPGALTPSIVLSLGLGLTLVVALALIDGNLHRVIERSRNEETPSYYFLGVARTQLEDFRKFIVAHKPGAKLAFVPMLRGRFVAVRGQPVARIKANDDVAWALEGDRGITFSETVPAGSTLIAGKWWGPDYTGPPLVSLESEVADGLGLKPGDEITVNVLGRNITTKIANLRKVDWRNRGLNFVLVYSPNAFAAAPYSDLVTLTYSDQGQGDPVLVRDVAKAFPNVVSLRVKDALDAVKDIVDKLALAVRGAAGIALLAATLVLGGALAAGQRARLYDVVILKTLGATRRRLLAAFLCEFGLIGLATAVFGVVAGGAAALAVVASVMKLEFVWLWPQALAAAGGAFVAALLLGFIGTWRVLGRKPAQYLRNL